MVDAKRLFGLKAVVTGASTGIGEAIVRTLIKQGAEVLAVDTANSGVESLYKSVRGVHVSALDTNASDGPTKLGSLVSDELGVVDIVICNVSPHSGGPIAGDDDDGLKQLLTRKRDLVSAICDQMLPMMKNSPAGRIVIIGFNRSVFAKDAADGYARSEASIAELTRNLAAKIGQYGINANYIQLGAIMTPESRRVFNADKDFRDYCIQRSAAKRLGEPVDIAKVALFLATDDSVFVSGTGIVVDGGISAT